jgi:hypothetical protein
MTTLDRRKRVSRLGLVALASYLIGTPQEAGAVERKGFIAGIALGYGTVHSDALSMMTPATSYLFCETCQSASGFAGGLTLGWGLTKKVAIVLDWSEVSPGTLFASDIYSVSGQYWPGSRFWVRGGIGAAWLQDGYGWSSRTYGLGILTAAGVEVVRRERLVIDLQGRFMSAKIAGLRHNDTSAVVGITVY